MTPDEVAGIFAAVNAACEIVTSKPTYAAVDKFDDTVNSMLFELSRKHDGG